MNLGPDIVPVLRAAAEMVEELTPEEVARLLNDAARMIETMRKLVTVQNDLLDRFEPPAGNA